jgi:hypothetical protein
VLPELRLHLVAKRALIENAIANSPDSIRAYVRVALNNAIFDIQKSPDDTLERFSDAIPDECDVTGAQGRNADSKAPHEDFLKLSIRKRADRKTGVPVSPRAGGE